MSIAPKHAVILAAGRGSRLGSMTDTHPKCLTQLAGKTLLQWQLEALRAAGIEHITVIGGYLSHVLTGDFTLRINPDWDKGNMVDTLTHASDILRAEPVILSYADILYHPDHVRALMTHPGELCMTYDQDWLSLWSLRCEDPLDDAEIFSQHDGKLQQISGRAADVSQIQGQYMGLLKITPCGWSQISELLEKGGQEYTRRLDMTALLSRLLESDVPIDTCPIHGKWLEVDTPDDYAAYQAKLLAAKPWSHDWRW